MAGARCPLLPPLDYSEWDIEDLWDAYWLWQSEDFLPAFTLPQDAELRNHKIAAIRVELERRGAILPEEPQEIIYASSDEF